jgi:hypothetical protein
MNKTFKPTSAVLENMKRGVALSKKYHRDSVLGQKRIEQVEKAKHFYEGELDIEAVKSIYNSLSKIEKSTDFSTKLSDNGATDDTITFYAFGGLSGLAWSRQILKSEGYLPSLKADKFSNDKLSIAKSIDTDLMQVTYVAMKIGTDLHGDYSDSATVRKAKESFNKSLMKANLFHQAMTDKFSVIESYLAPTTMVLNKNLVEEGEWLVTLQIHDTELWEMIKNDDITGVSIGAMAQVEEID